MAGGGFENDLLYAKNADFSNSAQPSFANGLQGDHTVWMGHGSGDNVDVVTLTAGAGVNITRAGNSLTWSLQGGGEAVDSFALQTGTTPCVPDANGLITFNGAVVAAGTNPVRTNGTAANTMALQVQTAQAIAATDATKIGLSNFDSAAFDVDANGFVQLNNGGIATTAFTVQANTAPGTNPVVPTAAGIVTVNGAAVANHSVVLESRSRAANAYNLEVQYATSAAASDATKSGVAHFDSASFGVDANGFVTSNAGNLFTAKIVLTSQQVKNLHGTPIQFVAAPGAGKTLVPLALNSSLNYGGTSAFTASASQTIKLYYATTTPIATALATGNITNTASVGVGSTSCFGTFDLILQENVALNLYNSVVTEIGGNAANDNTVTCQLLYMLWSP